MHKATLLKKLGVFFFNLLLTNSSFQDLGPKRKIDKRSEYVNVTLQLHSLDTEQVYYIPACKSDYF